MAQGVRVKSVGREHAKISGVAKGGVQNGILSLAWPWGG